MAQDEPKRYAPYLAWRTFFNLILQMDEGGLPSRIDRSYLANKSGLDQTYLVTTLRVWGLIDETGTVQESLRELVSNRDQRPQIVAELLARNYPEVFALPPNATPQQLDDVFRDVYGISSSTLRKAETFLLHGAAYAGLTLSPHYKAPRGVASTGTTGRRPRRTVRQRQDQTARNEPKNEQPVVRHGDAMRQQYFDLLLKKADATETLDTDLLDRIERLIGVAPSEGQQGGAPSNDG